MTVKKKLQSPALRFTYDCYIKGKPEREASYEQEMENAEVARKLYDLRTKAGLSQRALAKLGGTTASVICRLEDADYEGHSMAMRRRVAEALNKKLEIRFVPIRSPKARMQFARARTQRVNSNYSSGLEMISVSSAVCNS